MRLKILVLACAALSSLTATASAQAAPETEKPQPSEMWSGVWENGDNSMHVRATRCGESMCGTVVWADDKFKAKVAEKGRTLIGTEVFRDFHQTGPNQWKGKVYVPTLDKTVSGRIELTDPESITASACAFGPIGCQTRHYKRIR